MRSLIKFLTNLFLTISLLKLDVRKKEKPEELHMVVVGLEHSASGS